MHHLSLFYAYHLRPALQAPLDIRNCIRCFFTMDDFNKPTDDLWTPKVLCSACNDQIPRWNLAGPIESVSYGQQDLRSLYDIQTASLNGCHLCSIICHHLYPVHLPSDVVPSSDPRCVQMTLRPVKNSSVEIKHVVSLIIKNPVEPKTKYKETNLFIDTKPFVPYKPTPAGWSVSTGSKLIINLAKLWLQDCEENHPECRQYANSPVSTTSPAPPSHLIEIMPSSPPKLRLVETAGLNPCPRWVTLSHCWGSHPIFCTTEANLAENLVDIPLSVLPRTFQDAVSVTITLGHTHIWIDSLCIIQDSLAHWRQESAIMGNVYRGSVFTLAAAGAADSTQGFFRRRNPLGWHTLQMDLPVPGQDGQTKSVWFYTQYMPESVLLTLGSKISHLSSVEPLYTRGWVIQERLLSPRTIYFGSRGMLFECVTKNGSDTQDRLSQGTNYTGKRTLFTLSKTAAHGDVNESDGWKDFHGYWWSVVRMYTGCLLTRESDRLVAIGGIIKALESITDFENIAGLWRESFLSDLLWNVERPSMKQKNEGSYRAPTWSWASRVGEVLNTQDLGMYTRTWKAKLLDAAVIGKAVNGQIEGGYARLKGMMRKVKLVKEDNEGYDDCDYRMTWTWKDDDGKEKEEGLTYTPDAPLEGTTKDIWALFVLHCGAEHSWMNQGLTLQKTGKKNANGEDEWIRVGSFRQYEFAMTKDTLFYGDDVVEREVYVV